LLGRTGGSSAAGMVLWTDLSLFITSLLRRHPKAPVFDNPVKIRDAPDYYQRVTEPMWMLKVLEKLKTTEVYLTAWGLNKGNANSTSEPSRDRYYRSAFEWALDVNQIFINCRTYNKADSMIAQDCALLQKYFKALVMQCRPVLAYLSLIQDGYLEETGQHPMSTPLSIAL